MSESDSVDTETSKSGRNNIHSRRRLFLFIAGIFIVVLVVILIVLISMIVTNTLAVLNQGKNDEKTDSLLELVSSASLYQPPTTSSSFKHQTTTTVRPTKPSTTSVSDENSKTVYAQLFVNSSILFGATPGSKYIRGLTVLGNQLFVVRDELTQVHVYNTNNFTLIRSITITGSSHLRAGVASSRYNCLYISDSGRRVVYRYNLSDNVISSWSVGGECNGLSLTSTHNVLVTLYDTKQVKEYTPDGRLVREVRLNSSIERPWHSVTLSSVQFVVCHGTGGSEVHRVCIVDWSGRIIQCYGGSRGSDVGQLNGPRSLAVDGHGNVLVADWLNDRVVLLSPSLTLLGYITIPGHKLSRPRALHLDLLTRRLYIGEWTSTGQVFVLAV